METTAGKNSLVLLALVMILLLFFHIAEARVVKEDKKTYLVDRTGEKWDITQAISIGFDPYHFEFGIGRNAFQPLDESDWHANTNSQSPSLRIIGVAQDGDAHAYAVNRLRHHETANTFLGEEAIVAGY